MRVIITIIKYFMNRAVSVEYQERRFDSLLPTEPKEERRLVDVNQKTGEYTVEISRIAHE
jgi:hypothetical protein